MSEDNQTSVSIEIGDKHLELHGWQAVAFLFVVLLSIGAVCALLYNTFAAAVATVFS